MIALEKLHGIIVPEEYKYAYRHYLEEEEKQVKKEYAEFIRLLDVSQTTEKSKKVNQAIKAKVTLEVFTDKTYEYFLKILYVLITRKHKKPISIKTCICDAGNYAASEYLALSLVKSL